LQLLRFLLFPRSENVKHFTKNLLFDLLCRFEDLMDRRPLLLNSVLLRQNPHNVVEWQKRYVTHVFRILASAKLFLLKTELI
jgi:hypothetical protein